MRTLFLNPNADPAITRVFRFGIAAAIDGREDYAVRLNAGAPRIIDSLADNELAARLMVRQLPVIGRDFDQMVVMSSLDTGFDVLRAASPIPVHGFTRSVLAWQGRRQAKLNPVFFGAELAPAYQGLFEASGWAGLVAQTRILPLSPLQACAAPETALDAAAEICRELQSVNDCPCFIVGAVGITLSEALAHRGYNVLQPIPAMLGALDLAS